jgi:hypothetical protein
VGRTPTGGSDDVFREGNIWTVLQSACSPSRSCPWSSLPVIWVWCLCRAHHVGWAARDDCAHSMVRNDHESPNVGVCPTTQRLREADVRCMANLIQVSSAPRRALEAIDVRRSLTPNSRCWSRGVGLVPASPDSKRDRSIRRGMGLPSQPRPRPRPSTDLRHSQAELVWHALREGWSLATFGRALADNPAGDRVQSDAKPAPHLSY